MNNESMIDDVTDLIAFDGKGDMKENILSLEQSIAKAEQIEMTVNDYFSEGLYTRELLIPKGTVLTGRVHKTKHINLILKGDISIATEDGVKRIKAPYIFVAKPGTKKAGYAHEDTIWVNAHATDSENIDEIKEEFTTETHEQFLEYVKNKLLEVD